MRLLIKVAIIVCGLLLAAGCNEDRQRLSIWGVTAPDSNFVGRVGLDVNDTELGGVYKCFGGDDVDVMGGYILFHLTQEASIEDTGPQSPIAGLLEDMYVRPYAGAEFVSPMSGGGFRTNWIVGTQFKLDHDSPYSLIFEGQAGDGGVTANNDYGLFVGARILCK